MSLDVYQHCAVVCLAVSTFAVGMIVGLIWRTPK
jgi:hypothetical protein